ncbi:PUL domain-containing protein [Entamoeba marina]
MNNALKTSSKFLNNYGSRDAFFRTIQCAAKLFALLNSSNASGLKYKKRNLLLRIANLLGTSRKYFAIGNVVNEINNFQTHLKTSSENPEYILKVLKSGGMVSFFAFDNINSIFTLTNAPTIPYTSQLANLSFLVSVLSGIGLEYIKQPKDITPQTYLRYSRLGIDLLIALQSIGILPLPEELTVLSHTVSAVLCCVEHLK